MRWWCDLSGQSPRRPGLLRALWLPSLGPTAMKCAVDGGGERLHHTLFQTSTVDALLEGKYDGDVSFAELEARGDFGLGTLDALDGEMICLDGNFYQIKSDGRAYPVDGRARTPFAVVTVFEPDMSETLSTPMSFEALCDYLNGVIGGIAAC